MKSRSVFAVVAALLMVACSMTAANAHQVGVSGNAFTKDGARWVPQGFTLVGFVAPAGREMNASFGRARSLYGPALFARAKSFGADTLRLQVSQPGLDPQSPIFDPAYTQQVIDAVHQAEAAGFVVIISMQWEKPAGLPGLKGMPSDMTQRAWMRLVGAFANDGNVMLELFNEPGMRINNPQAWPTWRQGMQGVVDALRRAGAKNVLILDGIHGSHVLNGAPAIHDPLNKLAYAVHPYVNDVSGPAQWESQWGRFADSHPVLVSEWNQVSNLKNCRPDLPQSSQQLIAALQHRRIGVMVWALDLPNTVVNGAGQPLTFQNFQCGAPGGGAAQLAVQYMRATH
jgi:hypothetical protein